MAIEDALASASIVIPTYRRRHLLGNVLEPLLDDRTTGEVIVVVDGCDDGSFEFLQEWALLDARLHPIFQENRGQAAARQKGLKATTNPVVIFLDDDVVAERGMVEGHLRHHARGESVLVLGYMPTIAESPRKPGQVASLLYSEDYERVCSSYEKHPDVIATHLWAGNFSMRREDALRIGLEMRGRLTYHDDMLLGIRCQEAGIRMVFDRSVRAIHLHQRNVSKFANECHRIGEDRAVLCSQYPSLASTIDPQSSLPKGTDSLIGVLGSKAMRPLSRRAALSIIYLAGRLRVWGLETAAARVLRQIEIHDGFRSVRETLGPVA